MSHEVVAAMVVRGRKILLGKRAEEREFFPGVWDVFGGHVEQPGEGYEQTLVRELQEELGITPTQWTFVETITQPLDEDSGDLIFHLYLVSGWDGSPVNRQLEEHSEIGWFSLEEANQLPLADPGYPVIFARFLAL